MDIERDILAVVRKSNENYAKIVTPSVAYALDLAAEDYQERNAKDYKGAAEVLAEVVKSIINAK